MKAIGILLLLIFPCFIISQDMSQDFGTWTKIKSDFKINKKTSFTNKTELRTYDNSSQILQGHLSSLGHLQFISNLPQGHL